MINQLQRLKNLFLLLLGLNLCFQSVIAQEGGKTVTGQVLESGSGLAIQQAVLSVVSSGEFTNSDEDGKFSISVPSQREILLVSYPGYHTTEFYISGQDEISIFLVPDHLKSSDDIISNALGTEKARNAMNATSHLLKSEFERTAASSFDQTISGRIPGLQIIEHSGMPGHSSWVNLRGISSIFGRNEPLMYIDGMIHEINYPNNYIIEGYTLNPMDIVDVDDLVDITAIKAGEGHLGSAGSNGILYVNTEQKEITSATILLKMYGGIALPPTHQEVLDPAQFRTYFHSQLSSEGYSDSEINEMYPWLYGGSNVPEYYRYNNNTDWQKELFRPAALQKYYIYLKGGDDIATYNISSGYLHHGASYDKWKYSRYNLRLNGKVNITKRLSVIPNTKLSLSDNTLTNMGPTTERNPVVSTLQKSPLMAPNERSEADGTLLFPYDDVGVFNISNPAVLIDEAMGSNRNFQLLASVKLNYALTPKLSVSHMIGTSVNNDRANIFIPNNGVVQIDIAENSPQDMVTEFRSIQNHTSIVYNTTFATYHNFNTNAGIRLMNNTYKNNLGIDLNTPSDDFRSLGKGVDENFRSNGGQLSELKWVSYYGDFNYSYRDKYYLRASISYDASSVFNDKNRYNFYPSVFAAWRPSSEEFLIGSSWINDLKLRASYSQTGNMYNSIYDFSKMTYTGRRYNDLGVVIRDYNPNEDLEAERKSTVNAGIDLSFGKRAYNMHIDYYWSTVNNLIINQSLPYNFGFIDYYDNGGALAMNGIELGADGRFYFGEVILDLDAAFTYQSSKIKKLDFLNPDTKFLTREVIGAEYIATIDNPVNAFYGYKTNGVYSSDAEANGIIGPNGWEMGAGDVRFVDTDNNNVIDDNDKQIIGDPNPDFFGSLKAVLTIKRFDILALFTYCIGNDMYNYVRYKTTAMENFANQNTDVLERWQPGMGNTELPKATLGDPHGNNVFSDRWIEDASYLRLRQITLNYTAPKLFSLDREVTLYISGTNLFTLTKYTGYSPETMYLNDPYYMGIDYGKLPITRSIIIGIQLSL